MGLNRKQRLRLSLYRDFRQIYEDFMHQLLIQQKDLYIVLYNIWDYVEFAITWCDFETNHHHYQTFIIHPDVNYKTILGTAKFIMYSILSRSTALADSPFFDIYIPKEPYSLD